MLCSLTKDKNTQSHTHIYFKDRWGKIDTYNVKVGQSTSFISNQSRKAEET